MNKDANSLINFPGAEWRREVLKQLVNEKNVDNAVLLSYLLSHPSYFRLKWVGSKMEKIIRKTYLNPELALMLASKMIKTIPPKSMQQITQQLQLNNNLNNNSNDANPNDDGGDVFEELAENVNVNRLDDDATQFMQFQKLFPHVGKDKSPASVARRISMFDGMKPPNLFSINVLRGAILKAGAEWVRMRRLGSLSGFAVGSLDDAENIMPEAFVNDLYFTFLVANNSIPFMPRKTSSMPFTILAQDKSLSMNGEKDVFANSFIYTLLMSASMATVNLGVFQVLFNSSAIAGEMVMSGSRINIEALLKLLNVKPNGGTNPGAVLNTVKRVINEERKRFKRFFLLYITDAEWGESDAGKLSLFLQEHNDVYMYILVFNNDPNYLNKALTAFPPELRGRVRGHTVKGSNPREMIMYVRDAINTLMKDLQKFTP